MPKKDAVTQAVTITAEVFDGTALVTVSIKAKSANPVDATVLKNRLETVVRESLDELEVAVASASA